MEQNDPGKAEKAFTNFGKRVDEFLVEFNQASEKLQKEFEEKYDELKVASEKLKKEAENKERWREVEDGLRKAGEELSKAFKAAFQKKP